MKLKNIILILALLIIVVSGVRGVSGSVNYWRENSTTIWIKTSLTAGETKTFSISNTNTYAPNGDNVFEFFDDFDDGSIDNSKWASTSYASESGGYLTLDTSGSAVLGIAFSTYNLPSSYRMITRMNIPTKYNSDDSAVIGEDDDGDASDYYRWWSLRWITNNPYAEFRFKDTSATSYDTSYSFSTGTWYEVEMRRTTGNTIKGYINNNLIDTQSYYQYSTSKLELATWEGKVNYDYIFTTKYNDDATITINCNNNICQVTSDTNLTGYQIPLTTTYSTGNLSVIEGSGTIANETNLKTTMFKQDTTISINSYSYTLIYNGNFTLTNTTNTTATYTATLYNTKPYGMDVSCRALIDNNDLNTETSVSLDSYSYSSIYIKSNPIQLNPGTHNISFWCKKDSTGKFEVSNSVGIIYEMEEGFNGKIGHFNTTITNTNYYKIGSFNITTTADDAGELERNLYIEADVLVDYTNTADTYIKGVLNGSDGSSYEIPEKIISGSSGDKKSIGGFYLVKNATGNTTYTLNLYAKSTANVNIDGTLSIAETIQHPNETQMTQFQELNINTNQNWQTIANLTINITHINGAGVVLKGGVMGQAGSSDSWFDLRITDGENVVAYNDITANKYETNTIQIGINDLVLGEHTYYLQIRTSNTLSKINGTFVGLMTSVNPFIPIYFNVTLKDSFNNNSLTNYSVIDLDTMNEYIDSNNDGVVSIPYINSSMDLKINKTNYFTSTYYNHNTSTNLNAYVTQAYLTLYPIIKYKNYPFSNYTLTITGDYNKTLTITNYNYTLNISEGNYTITIDGLLQKNPDGEDINPSSESFNININPLDILNQTTEHWEIEFSIQAFNKSNSATISNLYANLTNQDYGFITTAETSGSVLNINGLIGNYSLYLTADGYEAITSSINATNNGVYYFYLYPDRWINITIFDEETLNCLDGVNLTISNEEGYSKNFTNVNCSINFIVNGTGEFIIIYNKNNYWERHYYIYIQEKTHNEVELYMIQNRSDVLPIAFTLYNNLEGKTMEGSYVDIYRYYPYEGIYRFIATEKAGIGGVAYHYLNYADAFYKTYIRKTILSPAVQTSESQQLFSQSYTLYYNGINQSTTNYIDIENKYSYSLIYNETSNNTYLITYQFQNLNGFKSRGCLEVYDVGRYGMDLLHEECLNGTGGTLYYSYNSSIYPHVLAQGVIYENNEKYVLISKEKVKEIGKELFGNDGLLIAIFITIILTFIGLMIRAELGLIGLVFGLIISTILKVYVLSVVNMVFILAIVIWLIIKKK